MRNKHIKITYTHRTRICNLTSHWTTPFAFIYCTYDWYAKSMKFIHNIAVVIVRSNGDNEDKTVLALLRHYGVGHSYSINSFLLTNILSKYVLYICLNVWIFISFGSCCPVQYTEKKKSNGWYPIQVSIQFRIFYLESR